MLKSLVMGVDIGGSHITAAVVDLKKRKVLKETLIRRSVDSQSDVVSIISAWSSAISQSSLSAESAIEEIGIGMPGPFDYEDGVCYIKDQQKYDSLHGLNVKTLLSESLGILPMKIRLMNDASCFLQGEAFGGAGLGFSAISGLTLGTGLGSSFYCDGLAVDAGLWNSAFKDGIAEDYLSTRWFLKKYKMLTGENVQDVKTLSLLAEEQKQAAEVFSEFGSNLGDFLNFVISEQRPDAVILGGNIAQSFRLFEKSLKSRIYQENNTIRILRGALGEEAAIVGAGSLWYPVDGKAPAESAERC